MMATSNISISEAVGFKISYLVFQMHCKFQNFSVCIAFVAHFLIDQRQTFQQLHDISVMEQ